MAINNTDRIQLTSIKKYLDKYKNQDIQLGLLISNLEILSKSLSSTDSQWNNAFSHSLLDLESIYAGLLERGNHLALEEKRIIASAIRSLDLLVQRKLNEFNTYPNRYVTERAKLIDENWLLCPICIDAWECKDSSPLVICPLCDNAFLNPRYLRPSPDN